MNNRTRRSLTILSPFVAAAVGGIGSRRAPEVYRSLRKPAWAPPETAFGPVWTVLYTLIGVAAARMSTRPTGPQLWCLHASQLALNAAWPWAFFHFRDRRASLVVIGGLDVLVTGETILLARRDRTAALLFSPYLAWCLFATALNRSVSAPL